MSQITARFPDEVIEALDAAASQLRRSRAEIVRQAVERYLEDFDDLTVAVERLRDPNELAQYWTGSRSSVGFSIRIKGSASKELERITKPQRLRIITAIDRLAANPFLGSALKGRITGPAASSRWRLPGVVRSAE